MPAELIEVGDEGDPRLADFAGLGDPTRRRRLEREEGIFVAEGWQAIARLLGSRVAVRAVLVSRDRALRAREALLPLRRDLTVYVAERAVVDAVCGFPVHRGVLAVGERPPEVSWWSVAQSSERLVVVEGVNDQENLGSLFRTAYALGVGGVLLAPDAADPLYRRSVRVSQGATFLVPWARLARWPRELAVLREAGWEVVALVPEAAAQLESAAAELAVTRRVALVVGAEGPGLSQIARAGCSREVRIAMVPDADSLNVAVAAAVGMWAVRNH